ncbi:hypothetical protein [Flexivirga lutea]
MEGVDYSATAVTARLTVLRRDLLGGRGPGASDAEKMAATRNRVDVGGMTATRRLELSARQTALARAEPSEVASVVQLRAAEAAAGVEERTGRLRPRPPAAARPRGIKSAAVGIAGVVAAWLLRRASRS